MTTTTTTLPAVCEPTPSVGCHVAAALKSSITIVDSADSIKRSLKWKWKAAATDTTALIEFRDPTNSTPALRACVYDASGNLQPIMEAEVLPGGTCAGKPCWKVLGNVTNPVGDKYKNKDATPDGLTDAKLKAGMSGKAQVSLKGKGPMLQNPPDLQLVLPVTVQLLIGDGTGTSCWQAAYTNASVHSGTKFSAKGP
jgi:hypothetical protein